MGRYKENVRLLIIIVTLCHWNGVKGNTLTNDQAEGNNYEEEAINIVEDKTEGNEPSQTQFEGLIKFLRENGEKVKNKDNTETLNVNTSDLGIQDTESDNTNTIYKRIQDMPLKLGLQFLTAKYGLGGSLDKARRGGNYIYDGTKSAVKTVTDFVGEGIGNARFLLFGTK